MQFYAEAKLAEAINKITGGVSLAVVGNKLIFYKELKHTRKPRGIGADEFVNRTN